MNEVRMPIETIREGNKITKICVEDAYKMLNRVQGALLKAYNNSIDIIDSVHKEVGDYEGELIVGTGISQPCLTDAFDEEIGSNIAFMKAKLNANVKKHNLLVRIWNNVLNCLSDIDKEIYKIDENIIRDLKGIRIYNPEYILNLEEKLGIIYEREEQIEETANED